MSIDSDKLDDETVDEEVDQDTVDGDLSMIGELVGNYRISHEIGAGGMGQVYEATHTLLGKKAAVKLLLPAHYDNKEVVDRFFTEAKATSMVHDPGIVEIFDYGHLPSGHAYIVMELLEGETLGDRLRREEHLSAKQSIAITWHIAGALSVAHRQGITHRDLKPDNVFLVKDPALPRGERAKVLDFGIAKRAKSEEKEELLQTKTGQLLGTPVYMSPEQCRGAGGIDHRSDIYSLGCLLYHMLCGRPPFLGEGTGEVLAAHIHVAPTNVRAFAPHLSTDVESVVSKMLEKDADARFQSMDEVIDALNEAAPSLSGESHRLLASSGAFAPVPRESNAQDTVSMESPITGEEVLDDLPFTSTLTQSRKAKIWPLALLLFVLMGLAAFGAVTLLGNEDSKASFAADASLRPPDAAPVPPPPVLPQEPVITQPETVVLTIQSTPEGAKVYRVSDGVRVGETPLTITMRRGEGKASFYLRKSGYHRGQEELSLRDDGVVHAELRRRGSATTDSSSPSKTNEGSPGENIESSSETPQEGVRKPDDDEPKEGAGDGLNKRDEAIDPFASPSGDTP